MDSAIINLQTHPGYKVLRKQIHHFKNIKLAYLFCDHVYPSTFKVLKKYRNIVMVTKTNLFWSILWRKLVKLYGSKVFHTVHYLKSVNRKVLIIIWYLTLKSRFSVFIFIFKYSFNLQLLKISPIMPTFPW